MRGAGGMRMEQTEKEDYLVLLKGGQGELVEKKSRFIATVEKAESEAEASAFIEEIKKKYWDASHNCSAFVIGDKAQITRCSDDGEPGGTAGRPMLEVLLGEGVRNAAVVVTRYFGGTLLGTGGLVRAYTQTVKEGLAASETAWMRYGCRLLVQSDYNGAGRIQYLLGRRGIETEQAEYTENVSFRFTVPEKDMEEVKKEIVEGTNGKARIEVLEKTYYIDKKCAVGYNK